MSEGDQAEAPGPQPRLASTVGSYVSCRRTMPPSSTREAFSTIESLVASGFQS